METSASGICTCRPCEPVGQAERWSGGLRRHPWGARQAFGLMGIALMLMGAIFHLGPLAQPEQYQVAINLLWDSIQGKHGMTSTVLTGWTPITKVDGSPITWACGEIKVVANTEFAPFGALKDLKIALRQLSAATGDSWVYAGTSHDQPTQSRSPLAPVLVAWVRGGSRYPYGAEIISSNESGRSGPVYSLDRTRWAGGIVIFNVDRDADYVSGFGIGRTRGALILHELGHVAGLGHVADASEIMTTYSATRIHPAAYSPIEVSGLRTIFKGCKASSQ